MNDTGGYFRDKTVFVTGASSGIGDELAWQLGQCGAKLTLAARRQTALEDLAGRIARTGAPEPLVTGCDVTRDGDVERAVNESVEHWGTLDVVIANAGFGVVGSLSTLSIEDYRRQFETNVFGCSGRSTRRFHTSSAARATWSSSGASLDGRRRRGPHRMP